MTIVFEYGSSSTGITVTSNLFVLDADDVAGDLVVPETESFLVDLIFFYFKKIMLLHKI